MMVGALEFTQNPEVLAPGALSAWCRGKVVLLELEEDEWLAVMMPITEVYGVASSASEALEKLTYAVGRWLMWQTENLVRSPMSPPTETLDFND